MVDDYTVVTSRENVVNAQKVLNDKKGKNEKQGVLLANAVLQELEKGNVTLDMTTLLTIKVKFFKAFIIELYKSYPSIDDLISKMTIEYKTENDKDLMLIIMENVYGGIYNE